MVNLECILLAKLTACRWQDCCWFWTPAQRANHSFLTKEVSASGREQIRNLSALWKSGKNRKEDYLNGILFASTLAVDAKNMQLSLNRWFGLYHPRLRHWWLGLGGKSKFVFTNQWRQNRTTSTILNMRRSHFGLPGVVQTSFKDLKHEQKLWGALPTNRDWNLYVPHSSPALLTLCSPNSKTSY